MRRALFLLVILALPAVASADPSALVTPLSGRGVDPVVVQLLDNALRNRVRQRGYAIVDGGPVADEAGLRAAVASARADIGVMTGVSIPAIGRYRLAITSVAAAAPGIWRADQETAGADVLSLLERILPTAVPSWGPTGPEAPAFVEVAPSTTGGQLVGPIIAQSSELPPIVSNAPEGPPIVDPGPSRFSLTEPAELGPGPRLRRVRQVRAPRWMLGVVTESALGTNRWFYNHLLGGRVQLAFSNQFFGFGTLAYAYYSDDPGFAFVMHAGIEGRVRLSRNGKTGMPVRFSLGWAPENGGLLKLDMGLQFRIARKTDLVLIPLAPTIWFLEGGNAVSMDLAIEINTAL